MRGRFGYLRLGMAGRLLSLTGDAMLGLARLAVEEQYAALRLAASSGAGRPRRGRGRAWMFAACESAWPLWAGLLRWTATSRLLDLPCAVEDEKRQGFLLEMDVLEENLATARQALRALEEALGSLNRR